MELETLKIKDIHPYEHNARKNDQAVDAVAKSIEQCSYVAPIVVDENYVILAGHTRWKALKKLGRTECECVVKEGLTEEQKKKYRLLDNKTNELADWDFDLLADELDGLDFGDLDLDWNVEQYYEDEGYEEKFTLKDGDRDPIQNMTFTFSDDQAQQIKAAISEIKKTEKFKYYENFHNKNGNGNALYLVVEEWLEQRI